MKGAESRRLILNEPLFHRVKLVAGTHRTDFFNGADGVAEFARSNVLSDNGLSREFDFLVRGVYFFPALPPLAVWEFVINQRIYIRAYRSLSLVSAENKHCPDLGAIKLGACTDFQVRLYMPGMYLLHADMSDPYGGFVTCELQGLKIYNDHDSENFVHADEDVFW